MSWDDLDETHYDWPTVAELRDYRGRVRALVCEFIERMPIELPIHWQSPAWVILMGIEHERIHLETSSVLIRQLPWPGCAASPSGRSAPRRADAAVPVNTLLPVAGGQGAPRQAGCHLRLGQRIRRAPHRAGPLPGQPHAGEQREYLEFVQAGGYERPGGTTRAGAGASMPTPACPPSGSATP
jgi:hypothetical protein